MYQIHKWEKEKILTMEISIIIPVYNKEQYIDKCIKEILNQNFDSFEVIAVDDGSNDKSGEICDMIAKDDSRLTVYHIKNSGVTAARKYGVSHANGKYIMFVDADDILLTNALKVTYEAAIKNNADEVIATYKTQYGKYVVSDYTGFVKSELLIKDLLGSKLNFCLLWGVLFKKSLIEDCLDTPREIIEGEDIMMQIKCLMKSPIVYFISDCVYMYNIGLPNNRKVSLDIIRLYDKTLREVLMPHWNIFKAYFTLHKIKVYEDFIERKEFYVFKDYYKSLRKELTGDIPLADRLIVILPPYISYFTVHWYRCIRKIKQ